MQLFTTPAGDPIPSVTADQMRELDRIAIENFGVSLLQMMENAGRSLATAAMEMTGVAPERILVLAGGGGNGGGGLAAARHLHNRGIDVAVALDRPAGMLEGAAAAQFATLAASGVPLVADDRLPGALSASSLVIDALIGYGLRGAPGGRTGHLIDACNRYARRTLSLDVPSGIDATTGRPPGAAVRPDRVLTLALPKTGLADPDLDLSDIVLADIGIPPEAVRRLGVAYTPPFGRAFAIALRWTVERNRRSREI